MREIRLSAILIAVSAGATWMIIGRPEKTIVQQRHCAQRLYCTKYCVQQQFRNLF
jgi:hypothetical protein